MSDFKITIREALIKRATHDRVLNDERPAAIATTTLIADLNLVTTVLQRDVITASGSHVDYAALRESEAYRRLQLLTTSLRDFDPSRLTTREERLAFWINLYNTLIIDAVIRFGIQHSVTETTLGLLTFFWRAAYTVGGQRLSADDIEHGILRANRGFPYFPGPHFADADPRRAWVIAPLDMRLHFALNCASRSCPPIRFYDPARVESQLEQATRNFLSMEVRLAADGKALHVSKLFQWYAADFGGKAGVLAFIAAHTPDVALRAWLAARGQAVPIRYLPYDWRLNSATRLTRVSQ